MRILLFSRATGHRALLFPSLLQGSSSMPSADVGYRHQQRRWWSHHRRGRPGRESVLVIMGATGTGKSKLSIDLATRFGGEVVNTDKIQVYRGLDITTNKIPLAERRGVPHHLLGELDPCKGELPPSGFRALAGSAIAGIAARGRIPVVAGGSNSFINALLADDEPSSGRHPTLRYRCCFLWVDVQKRVLEEQLDRRVDDMIEMGMVDELEEYFASGDGDEGRHPGLGKAIGVPEFRWYFQTGAGGMRSKETYEAAVEAIKENTRRLAEVQVGKIESLGVSSGWDLRRVDATGAVRARLGRAGGAAVGRAWDRDVLDPSLDAVRHFLATVNDDDGEEESRRPRLLHCPTTAAAARPLSSFVS